MEGNEGKLTGHREAISFKSAERQCYDNVFLAFEVYPTRRTKAQFDNYLRAKQPPPTQEMIDGPKALDNSEKAVRSNSGGGKQNTNPLTLTRLQDIFKNVESYFLNDPQRLNPGLGTPPWRPMPIFLG